MSIVTWEFESPPLHITFRIRKNAEIAQLVEHNLAKVGVASSSLVFRSRRVSSSLTFFFVYMCLYSSTIVHIYPPKKESMSVTF